MDALTVANKLSINTTLLNNIRNNYDNDPDVNKWAKDPSKWLVSREGDDEWEDWDGECDKENIEDEGHVYVASVFLYPDILEDCSGAQGFVYLDNDVLKMENHQGERFKL